MTCDGCISDVATVRLTKAGGATTTPTLRGLSLSLSSSTATNYSLHISGTSSAFIGGRLLFLSLMSTTDLNFEGNLTLSGSQLSRFELRGSVFMNIGKYAYSSRDGGW